MGAERVSIVIYLEPVEEGLLIYSVSGIYIPTFIANRIHLTPNINARITSLINWITEGLKRQESIIVEHEPETPTKKVLQNSIINRLLRN